MKIVYYIVFGMVVLLGSYYVISSLLGRVQLRGAHEIIAKALLIAATGAAVGILYQAWQVGELQGQWLWGTGLVVLAYLTFTLILLAGALIFGKK